LESNSIIVKNTFLEQAHLLIHFTQNLQHRHSGLACRQIGLFQNLLL